ncbi:hypothetical protein CAter282_1026 [Collimonas arenae]|uniref:Uncharacterized protein n=1 Tax=Collimonas arenae TaxID=279058 RepID=A0A127QFK3_9BURK|nr:hypothetical protein CAter282_1026 [Collimonas arenae]
MAGQSQKFGQTVILPIKIGSFMQFEMEMPRSQDLAII